MKLIYVEWRDPCSIVGWSGRLACNKYFADGAVKCRSIGWLINEDKNNLMLAAHISDDGSGENRHEGIMIIPKGIISRRKIIKELGK